MITTEKGHKHPKDVLWKLNNYLPSYAELAVLCIGVCKNEDVLYPPEKGFQGGKKFQAFLNECMDKRELTDDIMKKYGL